MHICEGRRHADRLHRHVDAVAVGEGEHLLLPVGRAGVDAVRGADLLGEVQPVLVQVDGDDLGRSVETGGRDDGQAHRARSDDGDGVARLDLAVLHADLEAGREDVRQQQRGLVGDVLRQPVERVVGERDADHLGLGAVDEVAEDPADADRALVGQAVRRVAAAAVGAGTARADAGDDDPVADRVVADGRADLDDRADSLVPEDPALGHGGHVALEDVQVGPADRGGVDPHDRVAGLEQHGVGDLVPALDVRTVVDECLHDVPPDVAGAPSCPPAFRGCAARLPGR